MESKNAREQLLSELISQMEKGDLFWEKPWAANGDAPQNPVTKRAYSGLNFWGLAMAMDRLNTQDPRFMTFNQARDAGWQVAKGSKAVGHIERWFFDRETKETDPQTGEERTVRVALAKPFVKLFPVFHASQIEGIPAWTQAEPRKQVESHQVLDSFIAKTGASISHNGGDRAYYRPSTDSIHLPAMDTFKSTEAYYATVLHEIGHWTGHESRLNRLTLKVDFGSPEYAREELRAELFSALMTRETGVDSKLKNHAAYLEGWLKIVKENPNELASAMADAQRACDFVKDRVRENTLSVVKEKSVEVER